MAQELKRSLSIMAFIHAVDVEPFDEDDGSSEDSGTFYPERSSESGLYSNPEVFADSPVFSHVGSSVNFETPGFSEGSFEDTASEGTLQDGLEVRITSPTEGGSPSASIRGTSEPRFFSSALSNERPLSAISSSGSFETANSGDGFTDNAAGF